MTRKVKPATSIVPTNNGRDIVWQPAAWHGAPARMKRTSRKEEFYTHA